MDISVLCEFNLETHPLFLIRPNGCLMKALACAHIQRQNSFTTYVRGGKWQRKQNHIWRMGVFVRLINNVRCLHLCCVFLCTICVLRVFVHALQRTNEKTRLRERFTGVFTCPCGSTEHPRPAAHRPYVSRFICCFCTCIILRTKRRPLRSGNASLAARVINTTSTYRERGVFARTVLAISAFVCRCVD